MSLKSELRKELLQKRSTVIDKELKSKKICDLFINSDIYQSCKTVLCYSSIGDEVNTKKIILQALNDDKNLFLPLCTDNGGNMTFYQINSLDDLVLGMFGITEPNKSVCKNTFDFNEKDTVCIVPAISFDTFGYRIGYGKGYYDRFLEKYNALSVGLCYNTLIENLLPKDQHDKSVDYIINENNILVCKKQEDCNGR